MVPSHKACMVLTKQISMPFGSLLVPVLIDVIHALQVATYDISFTAYCNTNETETCHIIDITNYLVVAKAYITHLSQTLFRCYVFDIVYRNFQIFLIKFNLWFRLF